MTPGCSVCGYAVEWLRSCYASNWRLFKGHPEILTPGYYYFADGQPFYPGTTYVASRNWTTPELIDPPLGEASGKQTYRKGGLTVARPPAILIGDGACVSGGDRYPLGVISRNLPGGIDSRCWTAAGQVAPDPSPALWLRPKGLPALANGDPVFTWTDSSVFGRDASNYVGPLYPTFDTTTLTIATVDYSATAVHAVPQFPLAGDFAIFVVGGLGVTGTGPDPVVPVCALSPQQISAPMRIGSSGLGTSTSVGVKRFAITPGEGVLRLYVVRRVSGVLMVFLNGLLVGTFADPAPLTFTVGCPVFWASGPTGQKFFGLVELQVYDQPLSDSGFASIQAGLIASYGPFP